MENRDRSSSPMRSGFFIPPKWRWSMVLWLVTPWWLAQGAAAGELWHTRWDASTPDFAARWSGRQEIEQFFLTLSNVAYHYEGEDDAPIRIPQSADLQYEPVDVIPIDHHSHQWLDLDGDSTLELLLIDDPSGRGFLQLNVIFQYSDAYTWQSFPLGRGNLYTEKMQQDLDGDGRLELLIEEPRGPYHGTSAPEVELVIYGLSGTRYVDATSRFQHHYREWQERHRAGRRLN